MKKFHVLEGGRPRGLGRSRSVFGLVMTTSETTSACLSKFVRSHGVITSCRGRRCHEWWASSPNTFVKLHQQTYLLSTRKIPHRPETSHAKSLIILLSVVEQLSQHKRTIPSSAKLQQAAALTCSLLPAHPDMLQVLPAFSSTSCLSPPSLQSEKYNLNLKV